MQIRKSTFVKNLKISGDPAPSPLQYCRAGKGAGAQKTVFFIKMWTLLLTHAGGVGFSDG
ncbi:hypothetical protein GCM10008019_43240 [Deinococcus soli (ex Cha et al. 2016)]|nr:hypothetical protein GCM10008019_43240 [Deinococcus soli (ex Cha et al. 2016)]